MPRTLTPGSSIHGYAIEECLGSGAFAIAYRARDAAGAKVFLKQYKVPTPRSAWYGGYVEHQAELRRRIQSSGARIYVYDLREFFEARAGHTGYFQAFEFFEKGLDLEAVLERARRDPALAAWNKRVTWARVFLKSLVELHAAGVVHTDLKPANVELLADGAIRAGFSVKLIDFDFAVLTDRTAPWHGHDSHSYVGTANYMSPEHLRGEVPLPASDVFTAGLIVAELLCGGHPFASPDPAEYRRRALGTTRTAVPRLRGTTGSPAADAALLAALERSLAPDAGTRPSAAELHAALTGRAAEPVPPPLPVRPAPVLSPAAPRRPVLELVDAAKTDAGAIVLRARLATDVGRSHVTRCGPEADVWSTRQFRLEPDPPTWTVSPVPDAAHATLLNGRTLSGPTRLEAGDELCVGDERRCIRKLPLRVRFQEDAP